MVPFVALSVVGTLCGALFTHYVMFPATIAFFGTFNSRLMKYMPRLEDTFDLYKSMMIGMVLESFRCRRWSSSSRRCGW